MPVINFQERFVSLIASGEKTHTLRRYWGDGTRITWAVKDRLMFYCKLRTKSCYKIGDALCSKVIATTLQERIDQDGEAFAQADGFNTTAEMLDWFNEIYRKQIKTTTPMLLIHWVNFKATDRENES